MCYAIREIQYYNSASIEAKKRCFLLSHLRCLKGLSHIILRSLLILEFNEVEWKSTNLSGIALEDSLVL